MNLFNLSTISAFVFFLIPSLLSAQQIATFQDMLDLYSALPKPAQGDDSSSEWPLYSITKDRTLVRNYSCLVRNGSPPAVTLDNANAFLEINDDCSSGQHTGHRFQLAVFTVGPTWEGATVIQFIQRFGYNAGRLKAYHISGMSLSSVEISQIFPSVSLELFVKGGLSPSRLRLIQEAPLFGEGGFTYNLPRYGTAIQVLVTWLGCSLICNDNQSKAVDDFIKARCFLVLLNWDPSRRVFVVGGQQPYSYTN